MRKWEFLSKLENQLAPLPEMERQEILRDYEEHFRAGKEEGKSEEEIVHSLGDPHALAKEILQDHSLDKGEGEPSATNLARAILVILSLVFFNLAFVLGPFIGLVGVFFGAYVTAATLIFAPVIFLITHGVPTAGPDFLQWLFASMMTAGGGLLLLYLLFKLTSLFYKGTVWYLRFNYRMIVGKSA